VRSSGTGEEGHILVGIDQIQLEQVSPRPAPTRDLPLAPTRLRTLGPASAVTLKLIGRVLSFAGHSQVVARPRYGVDSGGLEPGRGCAD